MDRLSFGAAVLDSGAAVLDTVPVTGGAPRRLRRRYASERTGEGTTRLGTGEFVTRLLPEPAPEKKKAGTRGDQATRIPAFKTGAGNRIRTGDPQLGKLMLYQLSYSRVTTQFLPRSARRVKEFGRARLRRG